ncbi:UbiA family prenyltransferase [Microbacterium sp. CIAB417]|uniref:UbiA family prenyltransferase n=1 Tax=Microbacterium sp. CIAB417 TaxID=2860287 RepID=UPI001FACC72D|nr:UbiA family prenyltransferase [Microbacterium sp. CIAB417]
MTRALATVRALWASTHPGPALVVTVLTLALGLSAGLAPWRIALLTAAVFAGQVSIGLSNDAIDAGRDRAVGRADKPLARGDARLRTAWTVAAASVACALLLSAPLGWGLVAAQAVTIVSAWLYNAPLKATLFSIVPFLVSFGLLPSLATLSAAAPALAAPWASAGAASLGAAVHLANVLPDLDDDQRTGIRGLPHRIGARWSGALAGVGIIGGAAAVRLGPARDAAPIVSWLFFAAVVGVAVVAVGCAWARRPGRIVFRLVMGAALLLAIQLVATGGSLSS